MATTTTPSTSLQGTGTSTSEHPLAEAGREATQDAGRLAERAADIGLDRADQGRQQVAETVEHIAGSIRRVSSELRSEEPSVAGIAETAAEQAERVARYLRETNTRQLIGAVEDAARRQPILFTGGAFLVGVAASRFVKAADVGGTSRGSHNGDTRGAYAIGANSGAWSTAPGARMDRYGSGSPTATGPRDGSSADGVS